MQAHRSRQSLTPLPSGRGSVMWWASQVKLPPMYSARMGAPLARACSSSSNTMVPVAVRTCAQVDRGHFDRPLLAFCSVPLCITVHWGQAVLCICSETCSCLSEAFWITRQQSTASECPRRAFKLEKSCESPYPGHHGGADITASCQS